ncbi:valine--tRNA ligase [Candidatus Parcubacteria bacterium]|nr:MAG: valine--tRNA ligase [Candidatus Parcubacteria bacterium]
MQNNLDKFTQEKIYQTWEEKGYFKAHPGSSKKPYSLLMPPPNLTGEPHMGHAMQHAILDALARFKRMQGFDVLLLPGVDHASIQFEGVFNKILAKEGLSKQKLGYDTWMKRAWQFKDEVYKSFHKTWSLMGISADWSKEIFTLDKKVAEAVLEEFKIFWEQDLLYKGAYIVQWCPKCGTAIEDVEMEYVEKKEKLYYVKYQIKESAEKEQLEDITIATARPETIFADTAIAVYPNHPKYKKYVGKKAWNPLSSKENALLLPIIEDKRVQKDFGTGALKITPGHDLLDYEIGKDHNLPILHAIDKNGRMTNLTDTLEGMRAEEARNKTVELLQEKGVIEKVEDYTHSVPVCERCKTIVEPLISEEWFVKMKPLAQKALKHLDEINFIPKNYRKIIANWYKEIHDWSISRSLWWGHRIPVWYCEKCNTNHEVGKDKDMIISLEKPTTPCKTCKQNSWVQEEQILDTWFSSGLWPLATLGWPFVAKAPQGKPLTSQKGFEDNMGKYYPWNFELTAPEIKYLWIARMIMLGLWFKDQIPFKNMFFHGTLRDLQGRKMSKSLGNGVDPLDLINQWGVDPVRMTLYSYAAPGRDPKASKQTMDERCKSFRNFGTKLKNIYRFIIDLNPTNSSLQKLSKSPPGSWPDNDLACPEEQSDERNSFKVDTFKNPSLSESFQISHPDDKKIIEDLNKTIKSVTKNLEEFKLHLATEELYEFIWHKFADVYIEKSKTRRVETQPILEYVLTNSLILLHPFMPFLTEELYQKLPRCEKSITLAPWPKELKF